MLNPEDIIELVERVVVLLISILDILAPQSDKRAIEFFSKPGCRSGVHFTSKKSGSSIEL
jgi:hypothetical protein